MLKAFFNKASELEHRHQIVLSFIVFVGISAIWWAGYVFFDECFLPKAKTHHRVLLAFLLGLVILAATNQLVTQLM
jgi:hypothetical protein